jgi:hypothetical protein
LHGIGWSLLRKHVHFREGLAVGSLAIGDRVIRPFLLGGGWKCTNSSGHRIIGLIGSLPVHYGSKSSGLPTWLRTILSFDYYLRAASH